MAYKDIQEFITALENEGELIRIRSYADPKLEMAEIISRVQNFPDGGKALLFENNGTEFPVLLNLYGSEKRMNKALGIRSADEVIMEMKELVQLFSEFKDGLTDKLKLLQRLGNLTSLMPSVKSGRGDCQSVIMKEPDITRLPGLTSWPMEGKPFISSAVVHTKDPETGKRGICLSRMKISAATLGGLHWDKHDLIAQHYRKYKELKRKMPVAVALGGDPVYLFSSSVPLPAIIEGYVFAGFLRKKKVELVKCITQNVIEIPYDADLVIEGYVDPGEDMMDEGPFAEHNGFYSLWGQCLPFHVTAVSYRKNAVFPAMFSGTSAVEFFRFQKMTEKLFLVPLKMLLAPELTGINVPAEGYPNNLTLVQIKKEYAGQATKVMNAIIGSDKLMLNKILVACGQEASSHDLTAIAKTVFRNLDPVNDIVYLRGATGGSEFASNGTGMGGKMLVDGTKKFEEEIDRNYLNENPGGSSADIETVLRLFKEIKDLNVSLLNKDIPCIIVFVKKERKDHIRDLHQKICSTSVFNGIKMILYADPVNDMQDLSFVLWKILNYLDPYRDHMIFKKQIPDNSGALTGKYQVCLGFDGTKKTKEFDGVDEGWPEIVASDDDTINLIDKNWEQLRIGHFIPSPSLKIKDQL
ncbi:MAG: hypothetical protein B6D37_11275 [Sphingobacteriales bacterium UTBCD1]|jgi:4-hydroxy-3-polyprenylbenzoate decarboxylase|nr:MAG: hypothetical protein B6D37_11275 [Sphingobacteriales bacterium UTBCD1]